jgi:hypothetical protein
MMWVLRDLKGASLTKDEGEILTVAGAFRN